MVHVPQFPVIHGHGQWSVFPADVQSLLDALGKDLYKQESPAAQLRTFRAALKQLSPYCYRAAATQINELISAYHRDEYQKFNLRQFLSHTRRKKNESHRRANFERHFQEERDLPYLLLFHGNGYFREDALLKLQGPLLSPIEVIALADQANNWVSQVRKAALGAISRCFPVTSPAILAASFACLSEKRVFWDRWEASTPDFVMSFFDRNDVTENLIRRLIGGLERRPARAFSFALQTDRLDRHLTRIFRDSKDAAIRAVALKTLLNSEAVWQTGYKWQWVDKSLGEKMRVPNLGRRKLSIEARKEPLLTAALGDGSAAVRRVAAQALIDHRHDLDLAFGEIVSRMSNDTSPGVRQRIEFLARKIR